MVEFPISKPPRLPSAPQHFIYYVQYVLEWVLFSWPSRWPTQKKKIEGRTIMGWEPLQGIIYLSTKWAARQLVVFLLLTRVKRANKLGTTNLCTCTWLIQTLFRGNCGVPGCVYQGTWTLCQCATSAHKLRACPHASGSWRNWKCPTRHFGEGSHTLLLVYLGTSQDANELIIGEKSMLFPLWHFSSWLKCLVGQLLSSPQGN